MDGSEGSSSSTAQLVVSDVSAAKRRLLAAVAGTSRGGEATRSQRGEVEEAQVMVESFSGPEAEWGLLEGKWRLAYTTAADVVPIVRPPGGLPAPLAGLLPVPRTGRVFQQFSSPEEGRVRNLIEVALGLAAPGSEAWGGADGASSSASASSGNGGGSDFGGAVLVVDARYEVRTARSIALTFAEAGVEGVTLGPGLQNLLAPALLPRGWWNQRALLAVQGLALRVPLATRLPAPLGGGEGGGASGGGRRFGSNYLLTYLDDDLLIGRAQGSGGVFIFTRETPPPGGWTW